MYIYDQDEAWLYHFCNDEELRQAAQERWADCGQSSLQYYLKVVLKSYLKSYKGRENKQ